MPRKYKSSGVKFTVMKYDQNQILKAIKSVQNGHLSISKAAEVFDIKRSTLQNKIKNKHMKKQGGQCALTLDEENCLVDMLITTSNWGFPFTKVDIRHITKRFLDNRRTKAVAFKDNFPGEDWATSFMNRYKKRISERTTQNITPAKAALSVETMNAYFDNLVQQSITQPKKPRPTKNTETVKPVKRSQQKKPVKRLQKKLKRNQIVGTECDTSDTTNADELPVSSNETISAGTNLSNVDVPPNQVKPNKKTESNVDTAEERKRNSSRVSESSIATKNSAGRNCDILNQPSIERPRRNKPLKRL